MLRVVEKAEEMYRLVSDFESGGYTRQSFIDLHGVSVSNRTDAAGLLARTLP